jgi:hypothetical protein
VCSCQRGRRRRHRRRRRRCQRRRRSPESRVAAAPAAVVRIPYSCRHRSIFFFITLDPNLTNLSRSRRLAVANGRWGGRDAVGAVGGARPTTATAASRRFRIGSTALCRASRFRCAKPAR